MIHPIGHADWLSQPIPETPVTFTRDLPRFRALLARLEAHTSDGERQRSSASLAEFLRSAMPDPSTVNAFLSCAADERQRSSVLDRLAAAQANVERLLHCAYAGNAVSISRGSDEPGPSDGRSAPEAVTLRPGVRRAIAAEHSATIDRRRADELGALLIEDVSQVVHLLADLAARHGWAPSSHSDHSVPRRHAEIPSNPDSRVGPDATERPRH
ncbi:hypothetical protein [Piscinibacter sp. XHJ-5]|uniref:hypothetical protein n=1 Tax=Piscinibacter sp. XHJ-5 TaxID=3037797 RepID=UPI002453191E|nr:hypothetical protein [Piscinibacter sp. XHJ-5]